MSKFAKWEADLRQIGGWDNSMVSVPSGVVRQMIEYGKEFEPPDGFLMGCTEGSKEEEELKAISDVLDAMDGQR